MDPSGTYIDCQAKAVGGAADGAEQTLKETYHEVCGFVSKSLGISTFPQNMSLTEAQKTAMSILKQVMEEKLNNTNVEVATLVPVDSEIAWFEFLMNFTPLQHPHSANSIDCQRRS